LAFATLTTIQAQTSSMNKFHGLIHNSGPSGCQRISQLRSPT
jgi:hypothetical protein